MLLSSPLNTHSSNLVSADLVHRGHSNYALIIFMIKSTSQVRFILCQRKAGSSFQWTHLSESPREPYHAWMWMLASSSVARGRRLSFLILMSRVSMNVDKDWRVLSFPHTSVCKHLDDISRATSPSLKTTLTWKETFSQDQGLECTMAWS